MKQTTQEMPLNAFLKIFVSGNYQRLYLRDVKTYERFLKKNVPPIPHFSKTCNYKKGNISS
jgi:hypothetical protein